MEEIGQGGNWKVYRVIKDQEIFIFREPKSNSQSKINSFIENYKVIQKLGLPTVSYVQKHIEMGKKGIKTEDINYGNSIIYVSHNSLYSDSQKTLHVLNRMKNPILKERKPSEAEEYRYRNKLLKITNFEKFILEHNKKLEHISSKGVLIDFDSYFFGSIKKKDISEIDYKLVDLDHINKPNILFENLLKENISEFNRAINGFVKYFVEEKHQEKYYELLK